MTFELIFRQSEKHNSTKYEKHNSQVSMLGESGTSLTFWFGHNKRRLSLSWLNAEHTNLLRENQTHDVQNNWATLGQLKKKNPSTSASHPHAHHGGNHRVAVRAPLFLYCCVAGFIRSRCDCGVEDKTHLYWAWKCSWTKLCWALGCWDGIGSVHGTSSAPPGPCSTRGGHREHSGVCVSSQSIATWLLK